MYPLPSVSVDRRLRRAARVLMVCRPQLLESKHVQSFARALRAAIRRAGSGRIILDWQNVRYISAEVGRPLWEARQYLAEHGGELLFRGLSPRVALALRLLGFHGTMI
jgi:anti-anti-sigma regulatory factor